MSEKQEILSRREEVAREIARRRSAEQREALQAELARRRLAPFFRAVWPIVEKKSELQWGWHLDCICEHLEAVAAGQIKRLAISLPAGTSKTKLVTESFTAWLMARDPAVRLMCVSLKKDLAERSSLAVREILVSEWFRRYFPQVVLADDQNKKMMYKTTQGGYRLATSFMSLATGEKGDYIIMDDPNDADAVKSKVNATAVKNWYDNTLHDRVNHEMTSGRVAIAHRTDKNDLIGHLVDSHGYTYLFIPEEFEPDRRYFIEQTGWTDPRKEAGELLRPERFGPELVKLAKKKPTWFTKHQQNPDAAENAFFKADWFERRWRPGPGLGQIVLPSDDPQEPDYAFDGLSCVRFCTIDPAASAKTSADPTACSMWCLSPRGDLVWLDCILRRVDIPDQPLVLQEVYDRYRPPILGIERAGANTSMYQFADRMGFTCAPLDTKGLDKLVRAQPAMIRAAEGRLFLPKDDAVPGFDVPDLIAELTRFNGQPNNGHDDRVDTLSMACQMLPRLSQVQVGRTARPTSVNPISGSRATAPAGVPIPPTGGGSGRLPLRGPPAGTPGQPFRPAVVTPRYFGR